VSNTNSPRRRLLVALAPLLALVVATPAFAQAGPPEAEPRGSGSGVPGAPPPAPAPPGRWIVELDTPADERGGPPPTPGQIDRAQAELAEVLPDDVALRRRLERVPYAVVEASPAEIQDLLATGVVREATPDRLLFPSLDDSAAQIGAPDVWATTEGASLSQDPSETTSAIGRSPQPAKGQVPASAAESTAPSQSKSQAKVRGSPLQSD